MDQNFICISCNLSRLCSKMNGVRKMVVVVVDTLGFSYEDGLGSGRHAKKLLFLFLSPSTVYCIVPSVRTCLWCQGMLGLNCILNFERDLIIVVC